MMITRNVRKEIYRRYSLRKLLLTKSGLRLRDIPDFYVRNGYLYALSIERNNHEPHIKLGFTKDLSVRMSYHRYTYGTTTSMIFIVACPAVYAAECWVHEHLKPFLMPGTDSESYRPCEPVQELLDFMIDRPEFGGLSKRIA